MTNRILRNRCDKEDMDLVRDLVVYGALVRTVSTRSRERSNRDVRCALSLNFGTIYPSLLTHDQQCVLKCESVDFSRCD